MQQMILLQILLLAQHVSGHHYAYHQELESITRKVAACGIWCFGFQVVGMVWS
jgi:fumarate reductase subunit D